MVNGVKNTIMIGGETRMYHADFTVPGIAVASPRADIVVATATTIQIGARKYFKTTTCPCNKQRFFCV